MGIDIQITDSLQEIENKIGAAIAEKINKKLQGKENELRKRVGSVVSFAITTSPEYQSAMSGEGRPNLMAELGFVPGNFEVFMQPIIQAIIDGMEIRIRPLSDKLGIAIEIGILAEGYQDLLSKDTAAYTYYSRRQKQDVTIPWLDWLLRGGTGPLVMGYNIQYGTYNQARSRSGQAIMVSGTKEQALYWRLLPIQYTGVPGDNFLTRALESTQDALENVIQTWFINTIYA